MNKPEFLSRFHIQQRSNRIKQSALAPINNAAVLVPIIDTNTGLNLILTQRAFHLRHHAGQICFPGGKYDPEDHSLIFTATREAQEEIGLDPKCLSILGTFDPFYTSSHFAVTPVIAFVNIKEFEAKNNHNEVSSCFFIPIKYVMEQINRQQYTFLRHNKPQTTIFIPYQGKYIWGVTAMIIDELCQLLTH